MQGSQASTFNNFAVYYRKIGKLHAALSYLTKCLAIEEELEAVGVADTNLNLCAVLSQLGRHEQALDHAQEVGVCVCSAQSIVGGTTTSKYHHNHDKHQYRQALILLQEELYVNNPGDGSEDNSARFSVLAIAFFNIGVEQEHMCVGSR